MAKISLNENELRSLIQEAISNVKVSDKPKKIKVKLSELKEVVKSVLKEYKYTPTPGFDVEASVGRGPVNEIEVDVVQS